VENFSTGQVYLDSAIILRPAAITVALVQFASGQSLVIPPAPNDPPPAAGNFKLRFQFTPPAVSSVNFLDSISCVIRRAGVPIDTVILSRYELSEFYEATFGQSFSCRVLDASTGTIIDNATNTLQSNNSGFTDFNTAIIFASDSAGNNHLLRRVY
jgi:hypothetical protein